MHDEWEALFKLLGPFLKEQAQEIDCSDLPPKSKMRMLMAAFLAREERLFVVQCHNNLFGPFADMSTAREWIQRNLAKEKPTILTVYPT